MVSTRPPISNSSSPLTKPLGNIPRTSITIGITVTIMFHVFFSSLASFKYLSLGSFSLVFTRWSAETVKSTIRVFFLIITWFGLLARIRWSVCILKPWEFYVSHSPWRILLVGSARAASPGSSPQLIICKR